MRRGGANIIQFRDKESAKESIINDISLLSKLLKNKTIFIINDCIDIAKIFDCDGIHLGQDDSSIEVARRILGEDKIIGISCHNLRQALRAQNKGADYISVGPIFSTSTKPEYKSIGLGLIKKVSKKIRIPFFAIGGINEKNIKKVLSSGAKRVAVCKAACQAKDIRSSLKNLNNILHKSR
jgi:thiamine-phosphate pyrophosphorylase